MRFYWIRDRVQQKQFLVYWQPGTSNFGDYFTKHHKTKFWSGPNPALHASLVIGKNILGFLLVVVGIILSVPGVPGQGLLTILLGIMLLDFPGRRRLELKLLQRPEIVKTINKLRQRFDKPPLELDQA